MWIDYTINKPVKPGQYRVKTLPSANIFERDEGAVKFDGRAFLLVVDDIESDVTESVYSWFEYYIPESGIPTNEQH